MERKDDKSFKRGIIVLISFPILFVSTSFLVNIGKEMSVPGFRITGNVNAGGRLFADTIIRLVFSVSVLVLSQQAWSNGSHMGRIWALRSNRTNMGPILEL